VSDSHSPTKEDNHSNTCNRKTRTRDMGGQATTHEFTRAVLDKMEAAL
jgi:isocitrate/isopropylmalate dehydrogenase